MMRLLKLNKVILISLCVIFISTIGFALTYQIKTQVVSVTTAATKLPTTPLIGRQYVSIQNVGSVTVYIGSSTVTADTASTGGKQLLPYATTTRDYDNTVDVYGIVASGSSSVIVEEGK